MQVIAPHPTPKDGIANYISQISQTGLIVVIVIAAGAFTFDARRGLAVFLRTRATSMWQLIVPRFTVNAAAVVTAYSLGTLAAWYEAALLLGSPPAGAMLAGLVCGAASPGRIAVPQRQRVPSAAAPPGARRRPATTEGELR